MRTVVIVDDEPIVRMDLSGMLEDIGFQVVGEAGDGFDAVEVCRSHQPDIVLMDVKMPVFDGLTAAETIFLEDLAKSIVLLTAYGDKGVIERAKQAGVTGYLMKPVDQKLLLPTLEVAFAQGERLRQSRQETQKIQRQLEETRLVRQAQTILAKNENVSESKAYQMMRQMSMDKRISMGQLAKAIIEQERKTDDLAFVKEMLMKTKHLSEEKAFRKISERAQALGCDREAAAKIMRKEMEAQS